MIIRYSPRKDTEVYVKQTGTGLYGITKAMLTKSTNILWWRKCEIVLLNSPRAGCLSIKNVNFWKKVFLAYIILKLS